MTSYNQHTLTQNYNRNNISIKVFSFGDKVIFIYFFIYYFLAILVNSIIGLSVVEELGGNPSYLLGFVFSVSYFISYIFYRRYVNFYIRIKIPHVRLVFSKMVIYTLLGLYLVVAFKFNQNFTSYFRHQQAYAQAGLIPVILFTVKTYHLIVIFISVSQCHRLYLSPLYYFIFVLGGILSVTGSFDFFFILYAIYVLITTRKGKFLRYIGKSIKAFDVSLFLIMVIAIVLGGVYTKIGFDRVIDLFFDTGSTIKIFFEVVFNRLFYHSYALSHHINNISDSFTHGIEAFKIIVFQSSRRLYIIFGSSLEGDYYQTVSRLNFILINPKSELMAGSSPGILGSIFFIPGSIFVTPLHIIFLSSFSSALDDIMGKGMNYGIIHYFFGIILLQLVFSSLMDSFNPVSTGFFGLMLIMSASTFSRNQNRKKEVKC